MHLEVTSRNFCTSVCSWHGGLPRRPALALFVFCTADTQAPWGPLEGVAFVLPLGSVVLSQERQLHSVEGLSTGRVKHGCTCKMMGASCWGHKEGTLHMYMGWGLGKVCLQDGTMDARTAHKGSPGTERNAQVLQPSVNALQKTGADGVIFSTRRGKRNSTGKTDKKHPVNVQVAKLSHAAYPHLCASPGFLGVSSPAQRMHPQPSSPPSQVRPSWAIAQHTVLKHSTLQAG